MLVDFCLSHFSQRFTQHTPIMNLVSPAVPWIEVMRSFDRHDPKPTGAGTVMIEEPFSGTAIISSNSLNEIVMPVVSLLEW